MCIRILCVFVILLQPLSSTALGGAWRHDRTSEDHETLAEMFPSVGEISVDLFLGTARGSAILISPNWLVTSAHFFVDEDTDPTHILYDPSDIMFDPDGPNGPLQQREITEFILHPNYTGEEYSHDLLGDIALIGLGAPVQNVATSPRYRSTDEIGADGWIVGYGRGGEAHSGSLGSSGTKRAGVNTVDRTFYADGLLSDFDTPDPINYPAHINPGYGQVGSADPLPFEYAIASGDSGGGVFIQVGSSYQLAGIISRGQVDEEDGALYGDFSISTRVSHYNDWIDDAVRSIGFAPDANAELNVGAGETFDVRNITPTDGYLNIGHLGKGTLNIDGGGDVRAAFSNIGHESGSQGEVYVDGSGSSFVSDAHMIVGRGGVGELWISNGASVSNTHSHVGEQVSGNGTVVLSGGAQWNNSANVNIGHDGTGGMGVFTGSSVTADYSNIAFNPGSKGTVTIIGSGSSFINERHMIVGREGEGSLTVAAGAFVEDTFGIVGEYNNAVGTALVTGAFSRWHNSEFINVGQFAEGELTIEDGGQVTSVHANVGRNAGSLGKVVVEGNGSHMGLEGDLRVGRFGQGTLIIDESGSVESLRGYVGEEPNSNGEVTITGTDSEWNVLSRLIVGGQGNGSVSVLDGGKLSSYAVASRIGSSSGSVGSVLVSGSGSRWDETLVINVGSYGTGQLHIENNAVVQAFGIAIGIYSGSDGEVVISNGGILQTSSSAMGGIESNARAVAVVTGSGSHWDEDFGIGVGGFSEASVTISNEGKLTTPWMAIALKPGSMGTVRVTGNGSILEVEKLQNNTVDVTGRLHVGGMDDFVHPLFEAHLGVDFTGGPGGNGLLEVLNGGKVIVPDMLKLWSDSTVLVDGGSITIGTGATETAPDVIRIWSDGTLAGNGTVVGDVINHGTISPGNSPGSLLIDGDVYLEDGGVLNLEIGQGVMDTFSVTGSLFLDGILKIDVLDGLQLTQGQVFGLFAGQSHVGMFDGIDIPMVNGTPLFTYDEQSMMLTATMDHIVPEPSTLALALIGIFALGYYRRTAVRRQAK